tara:strand:- start:192 stop:2636 length:2445 start_codon:yes stop_codon:yes gene_type:complete
MTILSRKNIKISVKRRNLSLNEEVDSENTQNQDDLEDKREQTAGNILKFLDKSVGKAEKSLFNSINLVDKPETFDDFLVKTREILVTAVTRVSEFSDRVLGNSGILINMGDAKTISGQLHKAIEDYNKETQQNSANEGLTEERDEDITKLMKALDKMKADRVSTQSHELNFNKDLLVLSRDASRWLKQYKANFTKMTGALSKQKLDPVEVFGQEINANIFTEMRLVYAISHMLISFSIVGKKDIEGPSDYNKVLNSQFIKKQFESGRSLFNSQFKTFLKGSFASDRLDKVAAKKVGQKPQDFKKALDIMKGGSLEESILRVESFLRGLSEEGTENFYSRLDKNGDLRKTFDCWSELANLDRGRKVDFLALLRSTRKEEVEQLIDIMHKQAEKRELPCAMDEPELDIPEFELTQFVKPSVIKASIKKIRKLTNIPFDTAGVLNQIRTSVKDATAGGGQRDVRVSGGPEALSEASQHPAVVSMSTLHKNLMQATYVGDDGKVTGRKLSADDAWKIAQMVKSWLENQKGANISVNESLQMNTNIVNETGKDMSQLIDMANQLYPYSQQRLGFNKPVDIRLTSDVGNSANPLGRTAYYDPADMEIVLYTDSRHPKDLLRSLSHELVHHAQNCRGEFDNVGEVGEGYAQKDDHLREMEKEAYLEGNMILRDWEDSIKENNRMLSEEQIRKIVREGLKKALFENEEVLGYGGDEETETDEEDVGPVDLDEECGDLHVDDVEEDLYESDLGESRGSADVSEAESHGDVREGDDVALNTRLEESDEVTEEEVTEESQEVTVESRMRDKSEFLFEKLTKMWTK